eukprot:3185739-Rhodomonas_salina.2
MSAVCGEGACAFCRRSQGRPCAGTELVREVGGIPSRGQLEAMDARRSLNCEPGLEMQAESFPPFSSVCPRFKSFSPPLKPNRAEQNKTGRKDTLHLNSFSFIKSIPHPRAQSRPLQQNLVVRVQLLGREPVHHGQRDVLGAWHRSVVLLRLKQRPFALSKRRTGRLFGLCQAVDNGEQHGCVQHPRHCRGAAVVAGRWPRRQAGEGWGGGGGEGSRRKVLRDPLPESWRGRGPRGGTEGGGGGLEPRPAAGAADPNGQQERLVVGKTHLSPGHRAHLEIRHKKPHPLESVFLSWISQ